MGFLKVLGSVQTFEQYKEKEKIERYKQHGLKQFLALYHGNKDKFIPMKDLKWGEEMEYQIYQTAAPQGYPYLCKGAHLELSNRGPELIKAFNESDLPEKHDIMLMPEFGGWMVEAVPRAPYNSIIQANDLLSCDAKLHSRRAALDEYFKGHGLQIVSLTNVPSLGTPNHVDAGEQLNEAAKKLNKEGKDLSELNQYSRSKFVLDATINTHPRFSGLVKSIRERRGSKVDIRVPIFKDERTNVTTPTADEPYPGEIYMDAMHFGMGQCCLQITYECSTLDHARYLHDMLLPFTGILAALSAAGPIQKGKLSDNDLRWTVISQSTDCRTDEERDPNSDQFIPKARYSAMNHYISNHEYVTDALNDGGKVRFDEAHKEMLMKDGGLDGRLAEHVAKLFTRDPVPAYEGEFMDDQIDDSEIVAHFENLQSTNWNSMRFKPPPSADSPIGWRVEFRTMDIQLTDFENTCLIVVLGLLTNVCNHLDVNFLMPISLVDANMDRAHKRDAILKEKFWFNTNCFDPTKPVNELLKHNGLRSSENSELGKAPKYEELFLHEIMCGKGDFIGVIPIIRKFIQLQEYHQDSVDQFEHILEFVVARCKGEVPTGAKFIRQYIEQHPLYRRDSIISPCLNFNLICQIMKLNNDHVPFNCCDCEKNTNSQSCDSCEEKMKAFEMIAETMDMAYLFEDLEIDEKQDEQVEQMLEEKKEAEADQGATQPEEEEKETVDEKKAESRSAYIQKQQQIMTKVDQREAEGKVARGSMDKIKKLFERIDQMKWSKEQARSILLGQQWFQGRTGVNSPAKAEMQEEKKDSEVKLQTSTAEAASQ